MVEAIRQALYASKIISYAQGYTLMRTAAKTYGWNLNYGGIALMWRGGCIIRSDDILCHDRNLEVVEVVRHLLALEDVLSALFNVEESGFEEEGSGVGQSESYHGSEVKTCLRVASVESLVV